MIMTTPSLDLKSTPTTILQKSLTIANFCVQQLCMVILYGLVFVCLISVWIAAHTLLNDQHLHIVATVDDKERLVLDLRPNPK